MPVAHDEIMSTGEGWPTVTDTRQGGSADSVWTPPLPDALRLRRYVQPRRGAPQKRRSKRRLWLVAVSGVLLAYILLLLTALGVRQLLAQQARQQHVLGSGQVGSPDGGWMRSWMLGQFTFAPAGRLKPAAAPTETASWSPDGLWLATGSGDGTIAVWRARDGRLRWAVRPFSGRVSSLTWSTDGNQLVAGIAGAVVVWLDVHAAHVVTLLPAARFVAPSAAFAPHGNRLAIASGRGDVQLWAAIGTQQPHFLRSLSTGTATTTLGWSPDGRSLAVGAMSGALQIWNVETGRIVRRLPAGQHGPLWSLQWSPLPLQLALGWADGDVEIFSGPGLVPARRFQAGGAVNTLAWSADGSLLAVTAVGMPIWLWDVRSGALIGYVSTGWDTNQVAGREDACSRHRRA